nr:type II toxin-antitoxin system RelE/ParE family toxin [Armatimonas sp.]
MDIAFRNKKLARSLNDSKIRDQTYGAERGKKLALRLQQLRAAANLAEFLQVSPRTHALKGNYNGHWAIDLDGPYRLIFHPLFDEMITGEAPDPLEATTACLCEVVDYH